MKIEVVVMAAGKGTRMKSSKSKVLQELAKQPMLHHVLNAAKAVGASQTVVITGHQAEVVEAACGGYEGLSFARQEPQLGTGHAVQQAIPHLSDEGVTVVLSGDVPLTQPETIKQLVECSAGERMALLSIVLDDPTGYGRVVREGSHLDSLDNKGSVQAIVEHKDASDAIRAIQETYTGIMAAPTKLLKQWLQRLDNNNAQQEYYLTDVVKFAVADGVQVQAIQTQNAHEVAGVNSPVQLAALERAYQLQQANALLVQGVRLADPARFDLRGTVECGTDVEIDVGCVFEGNVKLGNNVTIGAHCVIANCDIADGVHIKAFSHIDGMDKPVTVGENAVVGPYARLRPGAVLAENVHIGNFVEVKNTKLGAGAKANHLSYLGDSDIGARTNYGAGVITANYDGVNKHKTVVGEDCRIGSNAVLVAPVTLGKKVTVGAGSAISKDVPNNMLVVARSRQTVIEGWKRPEKEDKKA